MGEQVGLRTATDQDGVAPSVFALPHSLFNRNASWLPLAPCYGCLLPVERVPTASSLRGHVLTTGSPEQEAFLGSA